MGGVILVSLATWSKRATSVLGRRVNENLQLEHHQKKLINTKKKKNYLFFFLFMGNDYIVTFAASNLFYLTKGESEDRKAPKLDNPEPSFPTVTTKANKESFFVSHGRTQEIF